jgi:hypothetical protein
VNRVSQSVPPVKRPVPTTAAAEWNLVRAASSGPPISNDLRGIRKLLEPSAKQPIDWEAVLWLAGDHGTTSLLHQNLSQLHDMVPAAVLAQLRERYDTNVRKSLFLARELFRVLDCLERRGAEAIPYKGLVLSEMYYGDMASRRPGDMDLFVRASDVARIKNAVRDLGYTVRVPVPKAAEEAYIASGYECTFDSPLGKNLLELQWALQPRFYAVDLDMEGLFERAVNVTVAGRQVRTLSPEDLLLVLAVHAAKHVWSRLIWLCDIAQVVKRGDVKWDVVENRARGVGIQRILHVTLLLANQLLGMEIPPQVENAVRADGAARVFAGEIAVAVAAGVTYEEQQVSYFRLMMRLRERRMDRWLFLARLAFTPGPREREAVRLPRILSPLYRVVRLGRLAVRFGRG